MTFGRKLYFHWWLYFSVIAIWYHLMSDEDVIADFFRHITTILIRPRASYAYHDYSYSGGLCTSNIKTFPWRTHPAPSSPVRNFQNSCKHPHVITQTIICYAWSISINYKGSLYKLIWHASTKHDRACNLVTSTILCNPGLFVYWKV